MREILPVLRRHHVDQTILASDPKRVGNCVSACVASYLGLDLEDVPHFIEDGGRIHADQCENITEPLADRVGWWALMVGFIAGYTARVPVFLKQLDDADPGELVFVAGPSNRGVEHQTLYRNGILWHDPHPSRDGLLEVTELLVFREMARPYDHTPTPSDVPVAP